MVATLDDPWIDVTIRMFLEEGFRITCEAKREQERILLDGNCTAFDPSGRKVMSIHYENGLQHGPWIQWHPNGVVASEVHLEKGQLDGMEVSWDEVGHKIAEWYWRDGKKDGLQTAWDAKQRIAARIFWVNDEPTRLEQYKDGTLASVLTGVEAKAYLRKRALERVREMGVGGNESPVEP